MDFSLAFYLTDLWLIAGGTLLTLLVASEAGWRLGRRAHVEDEATRALVGGVAAATLGLLGLLLGFALSMAITRFDARRSVIVDEANAIGTLWLRAGLLAEPMRSELRGALRDYTAARVDFARVGNDLEKLRAARARSGRVHGVVWSVIERAAQPGSNPAIVSALITAANGMIDLEELRMSSLENYIPAPVMLLLIGVAAIALALLGWSFGAAERRGTGSMLLLVVLVTAVLGVIMDINRPHRGMIRVGDESILRLRGNITAPERP
jgi:hypothetical protein